MPRAVEEWRGATPDERPPPRVRLRIFRAHKGICHISKRPIGAGEPWDLDHIDAIINGGENRESNMAPALRDKHREKSAKDLAEKAKVDAIAKRHVGITRAAGTIPQQPKQQRAARDQLPMPAPKNLYAPKETV